MRKFLLPLRSREKGFLVALALAAVTLAIVPYVSSSYTINAMRDAMVLGLFALSYDLIWGKTSTLTLGHAVFFGTGAYTLAITTVQYGVAPWLGAVAGICSAALLAWVVGYFLLYAGVRSQFLAVISLAVLLIVRQIATSWRSVTGGDVGILGIPPLILGGIDLSGAVASYFAALTLLTVALLGCWIALRGTYGKVLAAIGMNEFRAKHCGFNTAFHLLTMFIVSASLAGLAGALYASMAGVVAPDLFSILLSTDVVLWVAIGGKGSLLGPVIASILLIRVQQEVSSYAADLWPLILGVVFLFFVLVLPKGLSGLIAWGSRKAGRRTVSVAK